MAVRGCAISILILALLTGAAPTAADLLITISAPFASGPEEFREYQDRIATIVELYGGEVLFRGTKQGNLVVRAQEPSYGWIADYAFARTLVRECVGWEPPCSTQQIGATFWVFQEARQEFEDALIATGGEVLGEFLRNDGLYRLGVLLDVEDMADLELRDDVFAVAVSGLDEGPTDLLYLGEGFRFLATADWETGTASGRGRPIYMTTDTGAFWFFRRDNVEVTLKILDGCALNGHYWVFAAGMTNVGVTLIISDRQHLYEHVSPRGQTFRTLTDTTAIPCS